MRSTRRAVSVIDSFTTRKKGHFSAIATRIHFPAWTLCGFPTSLSHRESRPFGAGEGLPAFPPRPLKRPTLPKREGEFFNCELLPKSHIDYMMQVAFSEECLKKTPLPHAPGITRDRPNAPPAGRTVRLTSVPNAIV